MVSSALKQRHAAPQVYDTDDLCSRQANAARVNLHFIQSSNFLSPLIFHLPSHINLSLLVLT
jgi:hypothetical protein